MNISWLQTIRHNDAVTAGRWLPPAIGLLVALLLGWQLWLNWQTWNSTASAPTPTAAPLATSSYTLEPILQARLFGTAPTGASNNTPPKTRQQLVLRGVFTASNPALASAIIEGPDGESRSFKMDSRVFSDSVLKEIHRDRIVLSVNGQLESLYFPSSSLSGESSELAAVMNAEAGQIASPVRRVDTAPIATRQITTEERDQLIRQRLQELRDRARQSRRQGTEP